MWLDRHPDDGPRRLTRRRYEARIDQCKYECRGIPPTHHHVAHHQPRRLSKHGSLHAPPEDSTTVAPGRAPALAALATDDGDAPDQTDPTRRDGPDDDPAGVDAPDGRMVPGRGPADYPPTRARPSRPDLVLRFPTPTAPGVGDTLWRGPAGRPLGIIMFPMGRPSPVVGSRTDSGPRLGARMSQCGKDVSMASARPRASRRTSAKPFFTGHYRR